jgi:septum formation protein
MKTRTPLILGSKSPRREEILRHFSYPFMIAASNFEEESIPFLDSPKEYVQEIAKGKALNLIDRYPNHPILTADTTVYFKGQVFNKPSDRKEAEKMLKTLSTEGEWHSVFTALHLTFQGNHYQGVEESKVLLNPLTQKQIDKYYEKVNFLDKAGGYAIQEGGGLAVKKIDGCFHNVRGLPVNTLHALLKEIGIDLWDYLA